MVNLNNYYSKRVPVFSMDARSKDFNDYPLIEDVIALPIQQEIPVPIPVINKRAGWYIYRAKAKALTNSLPLHLLPGIEKRSYKTYHIDHIVSIWDGYKYNIPVECIANLSNLRVISKHENCLKGRRSDPDALARMLTECIVT